MFQSVFVVSVSLRLSSFTQMDSKSKKLNCLTLPAVSCIQFQKCSVCQKILPVFDKHSLDKRVKFAHYKRSNIIPSWMFSWIKCQNWGNEKIEALHCCSSRNIYLIIVPQQSDNIPVLLHTPPSEFTYNFSIHNVYFIKENIEVQKVLVNNWNIVHKQSLKLRRA